jgi:hypothetical protein
MAKCLALVTEVIFWLHSLFVGLLTLASVGTLLFALPGWGLHSRAESLTFYCSSCKQWVNLWVIHLDGRPQYCMRSLVRFSEMKEAN